MKTILVAALLTLTTIASAKIAIKPLNEIQTGPLFGYGYKALTTRDGETKIVVEETNRKLALWNMATETKESEVEIPAPKPNEYIQLVATLESNLGEVVAVVAVRDSRSMHGVSYAVNLGSRRVEKIADAPVVVDIFTTCRGSHVLGLTSLGLGSEPSTYGLFDVENNKLIARTKNAIGGNTRVFEDRQGRIKLLLAGYEGVAIWDSEAGTTQVLVKRTGTYIWPRFVKDNLNRELIYVGADSKDPQAQIFYLWEDLKEGKLTEVNRLKNNEFTYEVNGRLLTVGRTPGGNLRGAVQAVEVRDFNTGVPVGSFNPDRSVSNTIFAATPVGQLLGLFVGMDKPNSFENASHALVVNLSERSLKANIPLPDGTVYNDLAVGIDGQILAAFRSAFIHPLLTFMDPISGKVLRQSQDETNLTRILKLRDGRLASIIGNTQSGETSLVDWTERQQATVFPEGTFFKGSLPYDYFDLDEAAMANGKPFLIPTFQYLDQFNRQIVGFRSFQIP